MKRNVLSILLCLFLIAELPGCGTIFFEERRGQKSGEVDPNVLVMDGFWLLFLIVPGLVAFGYDNLDFTLSEEAVVTVNFANGDPAQEFVFDLGGEPALTPIFFGVTSDAAISTVMIYSRDPGTTDVGQRANVIDNVILAEGGTQVVPEPATLLLLGTGLVASVRRWRRRA